MSLTTFTFLKFVSTPGEILELRGLGTKVYSGRFDDTAAMSRNAQALQTKGYTDNVYFLINPLKPEAVHVGDTAINKLARTTKRTAADRDILHRSLYVIDIDSVRPSGVCATEAERSAAVKVASNVQVYLTERGWPEPVVADSGNGVHLYYRGDGCDPSHAAWPLALKGLASKFSTDAATVDSGVAMRLVSCVYQARSTARGTVPRSGLTGFARWSATPQPSSPSKRIKCTNWRRSLDSATPRIT